MMRLGSQGLDRRSLGPWLAVGAKRAVAFCIGTLSIALLAFGGLAALPVSAQPADTLDVSAINQGADGSTNDPSQAQVDPGGIASSGGEMSGTGALTEQTTGTAIDATTAPALFLKAAEAYEAGQYANAATGYRSLVEAGFGTADVHYNFANALLRSGELGRAIASYRRAQILRPRDQDVEANLSFARNSTKDAVAPPTPPSWARTVFFWHHALSFGETVKLLIIVLALFWLVVAIVSLRLAWRPTALAGVLLVMAAALLASVVYRSQSPQRIAVVLPAQTDVFSGTDLQSRVIFNLHAGTELEVAATDTSWTQFRMPDGQRGWLPTEHLEIVDASSL